MRYRASTLALLILAASATPVRGQDSLPTLSTLQARVQGGDSLDAMTEFRLAVRFELARQYDDEERALRTAIAADPRFAPPYIWLGDLPYTRDKELAKQERNHQVPADRLPALDSAERLRGRAFVINPLGDLHLFEGSPLPQGAIILQSNSPAVTNRLGTIGVAAYFAGRYDVSYGALETYWNRRYAGAPDSIVPTWLLLYHGLATAQEGIFDKATHDLQVLVARNVSIERSDTLIHLPLNANAYRYVLAVIKERDNKPVDAIQLYQDIITRDLGYYMAHVHLAQIYRQYKMWDKAITEAQAAVEANPDDASLFLDLATIEEESGHGPDALVALKKAVLLDPRYPTAYYRLGVVAQQANQPADARDALDHFIAMAPHQMATEVADARKRIDSLH